MNQSVVDQQHAPASDVAHPSALPDAAHLQVAALQMVSAPDLDHNLLRAEALIAEAAGLGAQLISLPEYFCLLGWRDTDKVALREDFGHGPIQSFLSEMAKRHQVWLAGGTIPLQCEDARRVRNSQLMIDPQGRVLARYDKIHLFGFHKGAERFTESDTIQAGSSPVLCDLGPWRLGLSICYDLRFPELYRRLAPVDLLLVPSAFTYTTGQAHWEVLLRARAIENQCYVLAAAQGGEHPNGRRTWGHSMIIDPWGEVLGQQAQGEAVVIARLDRTRIGEVRGMLPALAHR
ncbi:MAG: carbon-nitrogen hydrolase family protein, partial [Betaproteobacteria bacterium]|nr:carbon-nitrogen hydrolase family protein [Betaproteobacteria bacterium]